MHRKPRSQAGPLITAKCHASCTQCSRTQPSAMQRAPMQPVLCAVPVISYALYLPYPPMRSYLPQLACPSLTFLSHVTYCLSLVLPVLAYLSPACAPYSAELIRPEVSTHDPIRSRIDSKCRKCLLLKRW